MKLLKSTKFSMFEQIISKLDQYNQLNLNFSKNEIIVKKTQQILLIFTTLLKILINIIKIKAKS